MKLFSDWGFTAAGWRTGQRGEYWVVLQSLLLLGLVFLPVHRPTWLTLPPPWLYALWGLAAIVGLLALFLFGKGLVDLGSSLTPLPYPREDGQLVREGVYGMVRHPIYSGVILALTSIALVQASLSHLGAAIAFFFFFNAKATREEQWLCEQYPDYPAYQRQVKKLLPWVY